MMKKTNARFMKLFPFTPRNSVKFFFFVMSLCCVAPVHAAGFTDFGVTSQFADDTPGLVWTTPQAGVVRVRIVYRKDTFPSDANDGTIIYDEAATAFSDGQFFPSMSFDQPIYFTIFALDEEGESTSNSNLMISFLPGVPVYDESNYPGSQNCGPVASARLLGYWDSHGYANLVQDGDNQSGDVNDLVQDLYSAQGFWSGAGTFVVNIGPGIESVCSDALFCRHYAFQSETESSVVWSDLTAEIDAGRPFLWWVNDYPDFDGGHFTAVSGYAVSDDTRWLITADNAIRAARKWSEQYNDELIKIIPGTGILGTSYLYIKGWVGVVTMYDENRARLTPTDGGIEVLFEDWIDYDWNDVAFRLSYSSNSILVEELYASTAASDTTYLHIDFGSDPMDVQVVYSDGTQSIYTQLSGSTDIKLFNNVSDSDGTYARIVFGSNAGGADLKLQLVAENARKSDSRATNLQVVLQNAGTDDVTGASMALFDGPVAAKLGHATVIVNDLNIPANTSISENLDIQTFQQDYAVGKVILPENMSDLDPVDNDALALISPLSAQTSGSIESGDEEEFSVTIPEGTGVGIFSLEWDDAGSTLSLVLTAPSGRRVNAVDAQADDNFSYYRGSTQIGIAMYTPESGQWNAKISGVAVENTATYQAFFSTATGPAASFVSSPTTGHPPLAVTFTDTSNPGSSAIISWEWEFGDGSTSTQQNPIHTYTSAGDYTVTLTVLTPVSSNSNTATISVESVSGCFGGMASSSSTLFPRAMNGDLLLVLGVVLACLIGTFHRRMHRSASKQARCVLTTPLCEEGSSHIKQMV